LKDQTNPSGDKSGKPFWASVHQPRRGRPVATPKGTVPVGPRALRNPPPPRAKPAERTPANLAARIVARTNRERPADHELRETLRAARDLAPGDARWISRAVFAYFRWREWLDSKRSLESRLDQAMGFADTYARQPQRFPDDDLVGGVVPEWVSTVMDVTKDWARTLQSEPKLWLRARPGTGAILAEKLGGPEVAQPGVLPDSVVYTGREDLFRTAEFHAGEFEIQDAGSQAVGLCCAPKASQKWWDMCAGEGGKTLHIADLLRNKGLVFGTDRAAWRLEVLKTRALRAQLSNCQVVRWEEGQPAPGIGLFEGVLLDAPCSGIGTWGRNPHARWTSKPEDVAELAVVQRRLIEIAAAAVKPGGRLVYAVCTLTRPETEGVCDAFDAAHPEFVPDAVPDPFAVAAPSARHFFWPRQTKGNGMFVAVWKRTKNAAPPAPPAPAAPVAEATPEVPAAVATPAQVPESADSSESVVETTTQA